MTTSALNQNLRQFSKQLKLGVLFYQLYYAPKGFVTTLMREGLVDRAINTKAREQMEQAAYELEPLPIQTAPAFGIHFLSGKKFWYQTCFCAYSMMQQSAIPLRPVIHDDGSLEQPYQDELRRILPNVQLILNSEIEDRIETHLPIAKFPHLRERRLNYPHMRKITDIHAGASGWKLVLDSDMLFFRSPNLLLDWLQSPQQPCHMIDVEPSYGYSTALMTELAQATIAPQLNVGICGLNSSEMDWDQLEYWCKTLIEQQGTHYYQEQALVAMLMAGKSCAIASSQEYIVKPDREEAIQPKAVLHHYVADSKPWYFRYAWKHIAAPLV
ncbi:MAG: glycosyl transferase [Plectolyngbya sp. WJT66-NPBG17]|jgi:lipopolysaccharide biosynthesis glycosyltransferase|nr:glycosyl transferase [Plectolyngbya sp. WJT66-NPBG17]